MARITVSRISEFAILAKARKSPFIAPIPQPPAVVPGTLSMRPRQVDRTKEWELLARGMLQKRANRSPLPQQPSLFSAGMVRRPTFRRDSESRFMLSANQQRSQKIKRAPIPPPQLLYGDSIRWYFSGAASYGGTQAAIASCLGGFRSSTEASRVGMMFVTAIPNLEVVAASRWNGVMAQTGRIETFSGKVRYTAPLSPGATRATPYPTVTVPISGESILLQDPTDNSKWVRVRRTGTSPLAGTYDILFHEQLTNVFGMQDQAAGATSPDYLAVIGLNASGSALSNVKMFLRPLGTVAVSSAGQLGASSAGTIGFAADALVDWPHQGWARIVTSGGTEREMVYYTSRTGSQLTVPAGGRARMGTTADAGASTDQVVPIPGVSIGYELLNPKAAAQTIASRTTAPTGITWTAGHTATSGLSITTLLGEYQFALWLRRDLPAVATATPLAEVRIGCQFVANGVTYQEDLAGGYGVYDTSLERYELRLNATTPPSLTTSPVATFSSLPYTYNPQLTANTDYYYAVDRRNKWNMVSQPAKAILVRVGADGKIKPKPRGPDQINWVASGSYFLLSCVYLGGFDAEDARADKWILYTTFDGSDPNLASSPIVLDLNNAQVPSGLEYAVGPYPVGTVGKIIPRTRRTSDSQDSANVTIFTAVIEEASADSLVAGAFQVPVAERGP
jgi:hypothetical protein